MIVLGRCHDRLHQGACTPDGLSEWQLAYHINEACALHLRQNRILCLRMGGTLRQRVGAINYLYESVGNPCIAIEVHQNSVQNPETNGFFCMAWHKSLEAQVLGMDILEELGKARPEARNLGLNKCSGDRRWIGEPMEYGDAPKLSWLQDIKCTSLVVESCHVSNPGESAWISNLGNRKAVGVAVAKGVMQYLKERD